MSVKKLTLLVLAWLTLHAVAERPNVIVVLADDVGYGDLECHGNAVIKTPNLNALHAASAQFNRYYVSPTCSPTRAALMTGRWPFEVGVSHTISGRSLLKKGIPTVADLFQKAGYRTGIFGKWHLGDNAPSRPEDRGFQEVFIHKGGGIGQSPDYWGNSYMNPTLWHNGQWVKTEGFCTEVFIQQAIEWSREESDKPFFAYIPLNVAHQPWTVKKEWQDTLKKRGVGEELIDFYALIEDMDSQIGSLLETVDRENTIIWFLSDNGTAGSGYNAGMKGRKGSVDEGGVRVPSWISWKGKISSDLETNNISGHVDFLPTLCGLAGVPIKDGLNLVGADWSDYLLGKGEAIKDRLWFTNRGRWSSRDDPSFARMRHFAVRNDEFRLVETRFFDMRNDSAQETDVLEKESGTAFRMLQAYQDWWKGQRQQIFSYVPIEVGHQAEPVTRLTAHDWHASDLTPGSRGAEMVWNQGQIRRYLQSLRKVQKGEDIALEELRGFWKVKVVRDGRYRMTMYSLPPEALKSPDASLATTPHGVAKLLFGRNEVAARLRSPMLAIPVELDLVVGDYDVESWLEGQFPQEPDKTLGCFFLDIERIGEMTVRKK